MLVLSRRENEAIVVDESITITVVAIRGSKVKLAIDAPPEVSVDRQEVYLRKAEEKRRYQPSLDASELSPRAGQRSPNSVSVVLSGRDARFC